MLTFAFVVVMLGPDGQPQDDYIMDYNLSAQDCIQRVEDYRPTADAMGYIMSCAPETDTFKAVYNRQ